MTKDERRRFLLRPSLFSPSSLVEPLSQRELEVLQLIAQGLSNREISARLFLALRRSKGTIGKSSTNSRSNGAPKHRARARVGSALASRNLGIKAVWTMIAPIRNYYWPRRLVNLETHWRNLLMIYNVRRKNLPGPPRHNTPTYTSVSLANTGLPLCSLKFIQQRGCRPNDLDCFGRQRSVRTMEKTDQTPETKPGQSTVYQIRIKGQLDPQCTNWF